MGGGSWGKDHCPFFFHQITSQISRAEQRVILASPGTSTAVLCWVSFKRMLPTLVYVSDVWDLLWGSLILLKDRSDPMEPCFTFPTPEGAFSGLTSLGCSLPLQPATICPCRIAAHDLKPSPEGRRPEPGRSLGSSRRGSGCMGNRRVLSNKKQPPDEAARTEARTRGGKVSSIPADGPLGA